VTTRSIATAFVLFFLVFGLSTQSAGPSTASASFGVSTIVQASCKASSPLSNFPTYAAALANATSSVSVTCTIPTPYIVSLSTDSEVEAEFPELKLNGSGPTAQGLSLQPGIRKNFDLKTQLSAAGAASLRADSRAYSIDGANAYHGAVIITIIY
jgi:hypothetical protein